MRFNIARHASRTADLRRLTAAFVTATMVTTTACDRLLSVDNPANVPVDALSDPGLMPTLEAGALQTFQCAYDNYIPTVGVLAGEYWVSSNFVDSHPWEWRGDVQIRGTGGSCAGRNATSMGFYTPMQQARFQLDDLFKRASEFTDAQVPNRQRMMTEARAYGAYTLVILGETMCDMTVDGGPKLTSADVWKMAEDKFTEAITLATTLGDNSLKNMAIAGRARVRLDMGKLPEAAADARLVPAGFVRNAEYNASTTTQSRENRIFNMTFTNAYISVAPPYQGLTVDGKPDPRVPVLDAKKLGQDVVTPFFQQQLYKTVSSPVPIASYAESQLILAEASTDQTEKLAALNRVRALNNISPLTGTVTDAVILEERRRQLFSQGQRYTDMLRKKLPFQTGTNRKGQVYNDNLTCIPLPDVETQNNPNFKGS
jgi:starch-binding outer membrane protein, SusD/RagB family